MSISDDKIISMWCFLQENHIVMLKLDLCGFWRNMYLLKEKILRMQQWQFSPTMQ